MITLLFRSIMAAALFNLGFYGFFKLLLAFVNNDSERARYESRTKRREKVGRLAFFAQCDEYFKNR